MKMFSNLNARLKAYREEHMGENGFSLLELVVAVGVLLALSVGGFLAYSGITDNAKQSAVESAASTVLSAAVAYNADGNSETDPEDAHVEYNASTDDIQTLVTVTPGVAPAPDTIDVVAWNTDGDKTTPYAADLDFTADRSTKITP